VPGDNAEAQFELAMTIRGARGPVCCAYYSLLFGCSVQDGLAEPMADQLGGFDVELVSVISRAGLRGYLEERALPGDASPDDQGVHLPFALVGVDCFRVCDEASDVMLQQDSVVAQQFVCLTDGFAHPDRTPGLRERRMPILCAPLVLQLR
jgi:hypothetical protein